MVSNPSFTGNGREEETLNNNPGGVSACRRGAAGRASSSWKVTHCPLVARRLSRSRACRELISAPAPRQRRRAWRPGPWKLPAEGLPGFSVRARLLPSCEEQFLHFRHLPDLQEQGWCQHASMAMPRSSTAAARRRLNLPGSRKRRPKTRSSSDLPGQLHRRPLFRCPHPDKVEPYSTVRPRGSFP